MRIFFRYPYFFIVALVILLNACGGKSIEPTNIPSDVSLVISFDFKSMSNKAVGWKDLLNPSFLETFGEIEMKKADVLKQIINSGFDYEQRGYLFAKFTESEKEAYWGISFKLKDAKKFEKALKESDKDVKIKTKGKMKYALMDDHGILSWEDKQVLVIAGEQRASEEKWQSLLKEIKSTPASKSLDATNTRFRDVLQQTHDIAIWADYQKINSFAAKFQSSMPGRQQGSMWQTYREFLKLTENVTAALTFEKGEIKMDSKSYLNAELLKKYKALYGDNLDANLVKTTPIKSPAVFVAGSIGMKGLEQVLKDMDLLDGKEMKLANSFLELSTDEIFETLTGGIVMALNEVELRENRRVPYVEAAIGLGIKNKKNLDKILDHLEGIPFLPLKKKGDHHVIRWEGMDDIYLIPKNDMLWLTTTKKLKDDVVGSKKALDSKYVTLVRNSIGGMEIDVQKMMSWYPRGLLLGSSGKELKDIMWSKLDTYGGSSSGLSGNTASVKGYLTFKDKNKNALVILMDMVKEANDKRISLLENRKAQENETEQLEKEKIRVEKSR